MPRIDITLAPSEVAAVGEKLTPLEAELLTALKKIVEMNRQTAKDQYGDPERAEGWSCVTVARTAIRKAESR